MRVNFGQLVELELPFSEACMHLRVAGSRMLAKLETPRSVQLYRLTGTEFSFPILPGEAGFLSDDDGFYVNPLLTPVIIMESMVA